MLSDGNARIGAVRMRSGFGLGDAIYLRPIAEHFVRGGADVTVMSEHPEVFIGAGVEVQPFTRQGINVMAHYSLSRASPYTQFEDMCRAAGIATVPLAFHWDVRNQRLVDEVSALAEGRPIVIVHGGREPFGRTDGLGLSMVPDRAAFDAVLACMGDCLTVGVGKADQIYTLSVDLDLHGKTSVPDLLDLATISNGVIGQCSFAVPLAEVFDKPLLTVWAGNPSGHPVLRQITPKKILHKRSSSYVIDTWDAGAITHGALKFREQIEMVPA
jgi:hypothetical protein